MDNQELIAGLINRFEKSEVLSELSFESEAFKLKLKKQDTVVPANAVVPAAPAAVAVANVAPAEPAAEAPAPAQSGKTVKSPIVGTFYASPSPDDDAFVAIGDVVKKGDVLCIVEAMKTMNEITSDYDGTVKDILLNNGDLVEFDQVLFVIE